MFENYQIGDQVTRMISGLIPMEIKVTELTPDLIICGPYKFSKRTGLEIDEELGWTEYRSGSHLKVPEN